MSKLRELKSENYGIVYTGIKPEYSDEFVVLNSGEEAFYEVLERDIQETVTFWNGVNDMGLACGGRVAFIDLDTLADSTKREIMEIS